VEYKLPTIVKTMAKRKAKRHGRGRNREGTGNGAINPISAMKNCAI
jgi:hypothetical protein